jgi:P pilus assembly chaperone PapD
MEWRAMSKRVLQWIRSWQAILLLFAVIGFQASASIRVAPMIINFTPGGAPYQDITVSNQSDSLSYVEVKATQILNPGSDKQREESVHNPKESGLLVTPIRVIIPPLRSKKIRLALVTPLGDKERIYRLVITQQKGSLKQLRDEKGNKASVNIVLGYGVKVRVAPKEPEMHVSVQRKGNELQISNGGNITAIITNVKQCQYDEKDCKSLMTKPIYPGQTVSKELPDAKPVTYEMYTAVNEKKSLRTH